MLIRHSRRSCLPHEFDFIIGYSPSDIAGMRLTDWDGTDKIEYERAKTLIPRKAILWPETVASLEKVLANRPEPKPGSEEFLFLKSDGGKLDANYSEITKWFGPIATLAGVNCTYYWLRHVCQTVGERCGDTISVKVLMGHSDPSISDTYREEIEWSRVQKATDEIHQWLFGSQS